MTAPGGFSMVDVIRAKRDGGELGAAEIDWVVDAFTRGLVGDEQMAALAMAVLLRGMTDAETLRLTTAMVASGDRMDYRDLGRPTADKHSTGGVGDKITLVLTPLVASFGVVVPQLSGRGLGHTGGTLDKLESLPGWHADLTPAQVHDQLDRVGAMVAAAGPGLAPADAKLYALRDVTGTVESVPLIASSIMSKKIAEGTGALVLDVKCGSGAFMKTAADARTLARTMVAIGTGAGVETRALITDMSTPLGRAVGNGPEVSEALEVLAGGGPDDVVELTLALAREMLDAAGLPDADPAGHLSGGRAMDVWRAMIAAQGAAPDARPVTARHTAELSADRGGVVTAVDAYRVGLAAWRLGAGRERQGDAVDLAAGVDLAARPGDVVGAGAPLARLHASDPGRLDRALGTLAGAFSIAPVGTAVPHRPLVLDRVLAE